ncbi:hypothetical protein L1987_88610 [Smallanthus sonchifolius]|nr:hypothetical protein L1987_88610 [Smallanthus sonchifolius]
MLVIGNCLPDRGGRRTLDYSRLGRKEERIDVFLVCPAGHTFVRSSSWSSLPFTGTAGCGIWAVQSLGYSGYSKVDSSYSFEENPYFCTCVGYPNGAPCPPCSNKGFSLRSLACIRGYSLDLANHDLLHYLLVLPDSKTDSGDFQCLRGPNPLLETMKEALRHRQR